MPNAIIENFSRGLDTRRSELTSAMGVLRELVNAHINQGGEIEKRKSFVGTDITPTVASGVTATFGIEALRESIVIFGGEANADSANWPPDGFTYQRLYRPATNAYPAKNATGIVYSTAFNGKTFVIAEMGDDPVACFYDGELVKDINYYGQVLPGVDTLLKLYYAMVESFENIDGYTAELNHATPGSATGIYITGDEGKVFDLIAEGTGELDGTMTVNKVRGPVAGIPGTEAVGSFTIDDLRGGQPGVSMITSIKVGGSGGQELLASNAGCDISPEYSAGVVVGLINANSAISGFNAENLGGTVVIKANAVGTTDNGKVIRVVTAGRVFIGVVRMAFYGTTFTVDSIRADGVELLAGAVPFDATSGETIEADLISDLINSINTGTGTHGFIAYGRKNVLLLGKQITESAGSATDATNPAADNSIPIRLSITQTDGGAVTDQNDVVKVFWDVKEAVLFIAPKMTAMTQDPVRFRIVGGRAPYTFEYIFENTGRAQMQVLSPSEQQTHLQQTKEILYYDSYLSPGNIGQFRNVRLADDHVTPTLKVKVTDRDGNETTSASIPVNFSIASAAFVASLYA